MPRHPLRFQFLAGHRHAFFSNRTVTRTDESSIPLSWSFGQEKAAVWKGPSPERDKGGSMNRLVLVCVVAVAFMAMLGAQDRPPVLPPGPAPGPADGTWLIDALFMQANMIERDQVMFLVPIDEPDPKKLPPRPAVFAKVDGKAVRAVGADRKPLDITELNKRLSIRAAVVVVHGQPPDPFFLKVLNECSVIFVVPKKMFDQMAKTAGDESLQGFWRVMTPGEKGNAPTGDHWIIDEKKIELHRSGKLDGYMPYKVDAANYPKTIDLTPDRGPAKGKALKGIYELDGNTLKICYVSPATEQPEKAERPKEIGAKGTVTLVFGRVPP
jgi:uncharacterized protein (TIGR03067 family)